MCPISHLVPLCLFPLHARRGVSECRLFSVSTFRTRRCIRIFVDGVRGVLSLLLRFRPLCPSAVFHFSLPSFAPSLLFFAPPASPPPVRFLCLRLLSPVSPLALNRPRGIVHSARDLSRGRRRRAFFELPRLPRVACLWAASVRVCRLSLFFPRHSSFNPRSARHRMCVAIARLRYLGFLRPLRFRAFSVSYLTCARPCVGGCCLPACVWP